MDTQAAGSGEQSTPNYAGQLIAEKDENGYWRSSEQLVEAYRNSRSQSNNEI